MKLLHKYKIQTLLNEISFSKPLDNSKEDWEKHFEKKFVKGGPDSEFHDEFLASYDDYEEAGERIKAIAQKMKDAIMSQNEEGKEVKAKVEKIVDKGEDKIEKDAKQSMQKMEKKSDSGADIYKNYVKNASSIRANTHSFYDKVTNFAKDRKLFWIFELLEVAMNEHYKFIGMANSLCIKNSDNNERLKELVSKLLEIEKSFQDLTLKSIINNAPLQTPSEVLKLMQEYR